MLQKNQRFLIFIAIAIINIRSAIVFCLYLQYHISSAYASAGDGVGECGSVETALSLGGTSSTIASGIASEISTAARIIIIICFILSPYYYM